MHKRIAVSLAAAALLGSAAARLQAVEVTSKAREIELTGRVHTQFNTTSVGGRIGSEFLIRRARFTAEVTVNDIVSGKVQPDFGQGKIALKDAFMMLTYKPNLEFRIGQFKRPFDLFELTSSTEILVIERGAKIRGARGLVSLSDLTEGLGYSDRDIGAEMTIRGLDGRIAATLALTNGTGADRIPHQESEGLGEKQLTGRLRVEPLAGVDLALALGATGRPYRLHPDESGTSAAYATAFQLDAEYGDGARGPHIQMGLLAGENWAKDRSDPPRLVAAQVIAAFKQPFPGNGHIQALEPLLRVSWADPDTDSLSKNDGGILFTPGVQIFYTGKNNIALNLDVFAPEDDALDMEFSAKIQSYVHF